MSSSKTSKQVSILGFLSPRSTRQAAASTNANKTPKRRPDSDGDKKNSSAKVNLDEVKVRESPRKKFSVKKMLDEEDKDGEDKALPMPRDKETASSKRKRSQLEDEAEEEDGQGEPSFGLLEVVWAKYSSYPSWPAIVCLDTDCDEFRLDGEVHVQFFDCPPSRAWVPEEGVQRATIQSLKDEDRTKKGAKWRKQLLTASSEALSVLKKSAAGRQAYIKQSMEMAGSTDEEWNGDGGDSDEEDDDEDDEDYGSPKRKRKRRSSGKKKKTPTRSRTTTAASKSRTKGSAASKAKDSFTSVKAKVEELSEYELIRQKNIESRMKMFEELNISDSKQRLSDSFGSSGPSDRGSRNASRRGLAAKKDKKDSSPQPIRKSLRLQKQEADSSLSLPEKEPAYYTPTTVQDEHPRRPLKTLELADVVSEHDLLEEKEVFMERVSKTLDKKAEGDREPSFGPDVKTRLDKLEITDELVAKVVPDRIFSLAVHPGEEKRLVAAGGKWGGLGLWDVLDTDSNSHGVHLFRPHSRPVNCMTFGAGDSSKLYSTSYDGTVRRLDLHTGTVELVYGDEDDDVFACYHRQLSEAGVFLVALGSSGMVGLVDQRESNLKFSRTLPIYGRPTALKTVDVHPVKRDVFVCSSSKGGCHAFDLRSAEKINGDLFPMLVEYGGHTKALSSAFFSPVSGHVVNTVCADNKIRIFDSSLDKAQEVLKPARSVTHNNQTGRWLTTFKAEWHPTRDDLFFCGSMEQPRRIDAFSDKGELITTVSGEAAASVSSIVRCHPTLDMVVGGNSSGRVHVFM